MIYCLDRGAVRVVLRNNRLTLELPEVPISILGSFRGLLFQGTGYIRRPVFREYHFWATPATRGARRDGTSSLPVVSALRLDSLVWGSPLRDIEPLLLSHSLWHPYFLLEGGSAPTKVCMIHKRLFCRHPASIRVRVVYHRSLPYADGRDLLQQQAAVFLFFWLTSPSQPRLPYHRPFSACRLGILHRDHQTCHPIVNKKGASTSPRPAFEPDHAGAEKPAHQTQH